MENLLFLYPPAAYCAMLYVRVALVRYATDQRASRLVAAIGFVGIDMVAAWIVYGWLAAAILSILPYMAFLPDAGICSQYLRICASYWMFAALSAFLSMLIIALAYLHHVRRDRPCTKHSQLILALSGYVGATAGVLSLNYFVYQSISDLLDGLNFGFPR